MTPGPGFKREEGGAGDKYYFQSGDTMARIDRDENEARASIESLRI